MYTKDIWTSMLEPRPAPRPSIRPADFLTAPQKEEIKQIWIYRVKFQLSEMTTFLGKLYNLVLFANLGLPSIINMIRRKQNIGLCCYLESVDLPFSHPTHSISSIYCSGTGDRAILKHRPGNYPMRFNCWEGWSVLDISSFSYLVSIQYDGLRFKFSRAV